MTVLMLVKQATYDDIAAKLRDEGWDQAFIENKKGDAGIVLDMHGIAIALEPESKPNQEDAECFKKDT